MGCPPTSATAGSNDQVMAAARHKHSVSCYLISLNVNPCLTRTCTSRHWSAFGCQPAVVRLITISLFERRRGAAENPSEGPIWPLWLQRIAARYRVSGFRRREGSRRQMPAHRELSKSSSGPQRISTGACGEPGATAVAIRGRLAVRAPTVNVTPGIPPLQPDHRADA